MINITRNSPLRRELSNFISIHKESNHQTFLISTREAHLLAVALQEMLANTAIIEMEIPSDD